MSKQLAISSAVSVMVMAAFVLYAPSLSTHVGALSGALNLPQLTGLKTLFAL
jgi:hypothetical protein